MVPIKQLLDENRDLFYPVTHIDAVRDEDGNTVRDLVQGGSDSHLAETAEDGFYIVDENLNIGAYCDAAGFHAKNILEHVIIEY